MSGYADKLIMYERVPAIKRLGFQNDYLVRFV
jgi:hypothetical protein